MRINRNNILVYVSIPKTILKIHSNRVHAVGVLRHTFRGGSLYIRVSLLYSWTIHTCAYSSLPKLCCLQFHTDKTPAIGLSV